MFFKLRHLLIVFSLAVASCTEQKPLEESQDSPVRSPQEELATFQIEEGFEVQLVASEPLVESPVIIQFDEDGRLWVVEMRGYMSDIEGSEESLPVGRIAILEDLDGDGVMDHRITYLDSLIMPRALGLVRNGALVAENNALWITKDLDGDWKADTKVLLDSTYASNGIPEHSDNGFVRNLDNWYYSAKSRLRYRFQNGFWIRDSTEFRGQWGISQDDQGRLVYNYNWSQLHADLVAPNSITRNPNHQPSTGIDHGLTIDRKIFPIRSNLAVNRGYIPGTLDSAGRLLEFTSACSPTVYRADLFPEEYRGNIFVLENAGNLVKRNVVREKGMLLEAFDPNPGKEFLASTDERFRPVYASVGPSGGLYIADMYQGIVQHGSYMTPYLKEQTLLRKLEAPGHMGRIWRIVPKGYQYQKPPQLSKLAPDQFQVYLANSNGFYRDQAQRIMVESGDLKIARDLQNLDFSLGGKYASIHGLYTLEGLGALDSKILFKALNSSSPEVQIHALRLLEAFQNEPGVKQNLKKFYQANSATKNPTLALQMALSSFVLESEIQFEALKQMAEKYGFEALMRDAILSSLEKRESDFLNFLSADWKNPNPEKEIVLEILSAAIIRNKDKNEISDLLILIEKNQDNWKAQAILAGMAVQAGDVENIGLVSFSSQPAFFKDQKMGLDQRQLEKIKLLFRWPGHQPEIEENTTMNLDAESMKQFASGRQKYLSACAGCHGGNGKGVNRMGPPLANSDWVLGDERRLSLILLHGIEGPIEVTGKKYNAPEILPVMPSHSTLDDGSIAAILTYIRNEWGNQAAPISGRTVGRVRHTSQGRVYPWSANELNEHVKNLQE
ncbi:Cytochrome c, mono-and diheme variants [Algoriphagus ornithinivorans]|uniref:Cytochrome c, mono-and diheme variants n=1 Tax=Algoriphagus ornithinivorans TaxID=226506 RepID=A0A1I5K2T3_9BACT|nr:c-type cytochrome [Algoriphagus ornithinivorans]SFO79394.1 Cytochrome c, mono-and diheme variants [Algoriphagus ornithinivorans]